MSTETRPIQKREKGEEMTKSPPDAPLPPTDLELEWDKADRAIGGSDLTLPFNWRRFLAKAAVFLAGGLSLLTYWIYAS